MAEEWPKPDEGEEIDANYQPKRWRLLGVRLIALITVLAFFASSLGFWPAFFEFPSLDFLVKSIQLSRNPQYQKLQEAVFMVRTADSQGTGFNIQRNGLVITNFHVVRSSGKIFVKTPQGITYKGTLVATNKDWDLALIKIEGQNLPVVPLGHQEPAAGERVVIIGDPLGFPQVIIEGTVKGKTTLSGWAMQVLRIHGNIHPGNSGSPVFNTKGQVVGVVFATISTGYKKESPDDGLAIPVGYLHKLLGKI